MDRYSNYTLAELFAIAKQKGWRESSLRGNKYGTNHECEWVCTEKGRTTNAHRWCRFKDSMGIGMTIHAYISPAPGGKWAVQIYDELNGSDVPTRIVKGKTEATNYAEVVAVNILTGYDII